MKRLYELFKYKIYMTKKNKKMKRFTFISDVPKEELTEKIIKQIERDTPFFDNALCYVKAVQADLPGWPGIAVKNINMENRTITFINDEKVYLIPCVSDTYCVRNNYPEIDVTTYSVNNIKLK